MHLDLEAVFGVEQHLIADLHGTHVRSDGYRFSPRQPLPDLRGRGNEDAGGGTALPLGGGQRDKYAITEHLDRLLGVGAFGHALTVPSWGSPGTP